MAVDAKRVKDRLKELFPKANLSTKRLDEISARLAKKPAEDADDAAIDEVINNANDFFPFEEIAKEDDRIRTLEQKAKANTQQPPNTDGEDEDDDLKGDNSDDTPAWAKAILADNKKLAEDLKALKEGKIIESKTQQAKKLFESSEVFNSIKDDKSKDFFFKQIDVNSETPFEDQIKELESTFSNLVQHQANEQDYSGAPPNGDNNGKPSDEEIDSIIENASR